jgi:hypothetical protein
MFFSCSQENIRLSIDENAQVYFIDDNEKYYENNILKYKINYKPIDNGKDAFINPDLYLKTYDAGAIENGKLTLIYNEIDDTICEDIRETLVFTKNVNISNDNAKIKIIWDYDIIVCDIEEKYIGSLRFGDVWCGGGSTIFFIYSTQDTQIIGKDDFDIYNLELYKGWNIVYYYRDKNLFWEKLIITTDGKKFPKDKTWYIINSQ